MIEVNDFKSAVYALIENLQRQNLGYFEEAVAIERLMKDFGLSQEEAARQLGKAPSTVSNKLRLLSLQPEVRELLLQNNLSERHAVIFCANCAHPARHRAMIEFIQQVRRSTLSGWIEKIKVFPSVRLCRRKSSPSVML